MYVCLYRELSGESVLSLLRKEYDRVCVYLESCVLDKRVCEYGEYRKLYFESEGLKRLKNEVPRSSMKGSAILDKDFNEALKNYMRPISKYYENNKIL